MPIAVGCDHRGVDLKQSVIKLIAEAGHNYEDFGCYTTDSVDYPDIAQKVAKAVAREDYERGILICGTGIGMAIAANKVKGIRAAVCHDLYSAERSRKSNNAQIMAIGALIIGSELAKKLVELWLNSDFQGGRSERKVKKIMEIETENFS